MLAVYQQDNGLMKEIHLFFQVSITNLFTIFFNIELARDGP